MNLLVSSKNVDIHMVKEYCLNTKIGRFEMFIIPFRFLLGKTSVMDVTLCRYGRDTSETQIEMV